MQPTRAVHPTRAVRPFEVISDYTPSGDQPTAIAELAARINAGETDVVLLGATGTGKSATTAWLIEQVQRPTLVMAHNKTLAAQLANEFRELMPNNAVEYFVSYYDYYQPEAYVPQTDTFIEKDSSINAEVERLRHSTTNSLLSRRDVIVVVHGVLHLRPRQLEEYLDAMLAMQVGMSINRDALIRKFVSMQYQRNDVDFSRGNFRVRGDTIEIIPMYEELALRIEMFGDEIEALYSLHPLTGDVVKKLDAVSVFPAIPLRRRARRRCTGRSAPSARTGRAAGAAGAGGQAARGPAAADAHHVRPGDDGADRLLQRHRELLPAHRRPRAGGGAALPARLLPRRLPRRHRRVARHRPADRRDVRGRRLAQTHPGRARLPAAERPRQPPAEVLRIPRPRRPEGLPLRDPRSLRVGDHRRHRVEQIIRPDRPHRPGNRRQAEQGPDRRPARTRSGCAASGTNGCSSPP